MIDLPVREYLTSLFLDETRIGSDISLLLNAAVIVGIS